MADEPVTGSKISREGAGPYIIQVLGRLARHWEPELRMQLTYSQTESGTITTLSGQLPDQAALFGNLGRLTMWGYLILMVRYEVELGAAWEQDD